RSDVYYFFFFFSSRRRHTRFSRDWSSDVCSSDLRNRRRWSARRGTIPVRRPVPAVVVGRWAFPTTWEERRRVSRRWPGRGGRRQIGRASCRERVEITGGEVVFEKRSTDRRDEEQ